ncbi:MAG: glycosyltransferase family 39 protein [Phormidium sp.]
MMYIKNELCSGKTIERKFSNILALKAFGEKFWIFLAFLSLTAVTIAAVFWIFAHPYGTNWDEARYINRIYRDVAFFQQGGIGEFLKGVINEDRSRPPAYRLIVLPFNLLFGINPTTMRLVSLASLWVTLGFIYLAGKRIAGEISGAFAAIFLAICPIIIAGNMRFYVDYPLQLAIAAMLYFLVLDWDREAERKISWIGFGIALGLGGLAKPPILFIALPMIAVTLFLNWRKIIIRPNLGWMIKGSALSLIIMLPWWIFNFKPAIAKAFLSGKFVRHSLGEKGSLVTFGKWLFVFSQSLLGSALTLLFLAIIATFMIKLLNKKLQINAVTAGAIAVCLAGSLPMLMLSAMGTNQNARLISPSLITLAVAIGAIAALTGWTTNKLLAGIATILICFQLTVMISPTPGEIKYQTGDTASQQLLWGNYTNTMKRREQWDWSPVRKIVNQQQITNPLITYLGNYGTFNPPQIALPWVKENEPVNVAWLWQYTFGEINWNQVLTAAKSSNVVITAPQLIGGKADKQHLDNQHNTEFVKRLEKMPEFSPPIKLMMGRYQPVEVFLFINKKADPTKLPAEVRRLDIF